ncbi:MAG: hypothetical protein JOZ69_20180, partial [Myxococcales bacterium]|nr:hypothetical protein [Myxococcales bacterium]
LDGQHVLLAGGTTSSVASAGVRTLDLACAAGCSPATWPDLPGALALAPAMVFASDGAHAVVVGDTADGATHVVAVTPTSATEIAPRVPHERARAVVSPIGSVVLYGGDGAIESFVPQ